MVINSPLLTVSSDEDVKFYLLFKKDSPHDRHPLYVSIESEHMDGIIPKSREDDIKFHHISGSDQAVRKTNTM